MTPFLGTCFDTCALNEVNNAFNHSLSYLNSTYGHKRLNSTEDMLMDLVFGIENLKKEIMDNGLIPKFFDPQDSLCKDCLIDDCTRCSFDPSTSSPICSSCAFGFESISGLCSPIACD